ncbi:hypothetical protein V501_09252, partial [Pseudogymnoascus sp. VKM F-4519 (FW-2642)]
VERVRSTFDDDTYPLPQHQKHSFDLYVELFQEDAISFAKRSKQRRSARLKARTLLSDVFIALGSQVFFLCALAVAISTLDTVEIKGLVPTLRQWWTTVSHPKGLVETANQVCTASSISALISKGSTGSNKRISDSDPSDHQVLQDQSPPKRPRLSSPVHASESLDETLTIKTKKYVASETITNLQLGDLFSFMSEYQGGCTLLTMQLFPEDFTSLPSIGITFGSSAEPDATIIFKREMCTELIRHTIQKGQSKLRFTS